MRSTVYLTVMDTYIYELEHFYTIMNAPFTALQCGPRIQRYHRECGPMDFASQDSFLDAFSTRRTVTVVKCIAWIRYWFVIGTRQNFGPASRRRALHLTWAKLHRWAIISRERHQIEWNGQAIAVQLPYCEVLFSRNAIFAHLGHRGKK